jgi:alpha-L-arabinofuranosidase
MLTIKNIEKLFRQDVGHWRISGVETQKFTYLIHLRKLNGEKHQINIERLAIGNEYEMWTWKTKHSIKNMQGSATPERLMVTKDMLRTMDHALTRMNLLMM